MKCLLLTKLEGIEDVVAMCVHEVQVSTYLNDSLGSPDLRSIDSPTSTPSSLATLALKLR